LTTDCMQTRQFLLRGPLFIGTLIVFIAATTGVAGAQQSQLPHQAASSHASYALLLDAGDLLDVRVFDTPDLSEKLRVDQGGDITLPVGGMVRVQGLTAEQAQTAIEERFRQRNILHDPHVEVFVLEYATQGVTVAGEVKLPGVYPWSGKRSVLDFVSLAGGVTAAASKTFTLTHKNPAALVVTAELSDTSPTADVEPGDLIVVTRAGVVYVVGDVGKPGGYLIENKETITVLQALALAQGMNKTAKYDARLIRNSPAGRTEADLPLKKILANQVTDPRLQDGDILFVPVSGGKEWADKSVTSILQMAVGVVIYGRF
jgi:polysaccharide export outer membrane protein